MNTVTRLEPDTGHSCLFHVSEDGAIARFDPRPPPAPEVGTAGACVWAVDEDHLAHYLLPRDCPRIAFRASEMSREEDVERLIGPDPEARVVAIEAAWFKRACETAIWLYELPPGTFTVADAGAGYYISREFVVPLGKREVRHPLAEMISQGVELRVVPSLWPLHDAVIHSSLQFSCIRMRNAGARNFRKR